MASDLPRSRAELARAGHQLRRHPHNPLATREQKALQRPGHVPAVLDRPHPLARPRRGPIATDPRTTAAWPSPCARPARDRSPRRPRATVCERLCVSAPITIIRTVPSLGSPINGSPADTSQSGRCHAPYLCRAPASSAGSGIDGLDRWAAAVRARGWWCGSCARGRPALSRSAVPPCGGAGDMMVDGVIPLGEALRPLGLSGPSTLAWRQERAGSRPRCIR